MATDPNPRHALLDKLDQLPPERVVEVEDFVDCRDQSRSLTQAAAKVSEAGFRQVWDNPDDATYDQL